MEEGTTIKEVQGSKGISNTGMTMLVVAVMVVMIIGTWAVLNSINPGGDVQQAPKIVNKDSGEITMTVLADTEVKSSDNGIVKLNVISSNQ